MNYKKGLNIAAITFFTGFVGCSSTPKLAPLLEMPIAPSDKINSITSDITLKNQYSIKDNVVQSLAQTIKPGASVVINVPAKMFEQKDKMQKQAADSDAFHTKEFFNYAEQEIERELIKHGFRVLSRSKFEAKLRQLRDQHSNYDYSKVDSEANVILRKLEKSFENGIISATEYAAQVKEFKAEFQNSTAGKTRQEGDQELTDISEVIRAAESGPIQSDYILQINNFDTDKKSKIEVNLLASADIKLFTSTHPNIRNEFTQRQYMNCLTEGAELNAKLIDVKTGAIVWIGKHEVNELSAGVSTLTVEVGEKTYVDNKSSVQAFVNNENRNSSRIKRYGKEVSTPDWSYSSSLIGPLVISGRCNTGGSPSYMDRSTRTKLARAVAKELIREIIVTH